MGHQRIQCGQLDFVTLCGVQLIYVISFSEMSVRIIEEGKLMELSVGLISNNFGPKINVWRKNPVFRDNLRPSLNRWDGS